MRVVAFITLLFLSTLLPWYVLFVFALLYALVWSAYELMVIAVAIDAYYGVVAFIPYYTLATLCLLIALEWAKPHLLIYNR